MAAPPGLTTPYNFNRHQNQSPFQAGPGSTTTPNSSSGGSTGYSPVFTFNVAPPATNPYDRAFYHQTG